MRCVQDAFRDRFNKEPMNRNGLKQLISKFEATGSEHDAPRCGRSDHTEKNQLLKPFFKMLTSDEKATGLFQQDWATCHTANLTKEVLEEVFNTRLISKPKWPARNPDLTPPYFFLWGMLKGRVYEKNPTDLSALKSKIKSEIAKVTEAQLSDVFENLKKRVQMCESENGEHFQHLM